METAQPVRRGNRGQRQPHQERPRGVMEGKTGGPRPKAKEKSKKKKMQQVQSGRTQMTAGAGAPARKTYVAGESHGFPGNVASIMDAWDHMMVAKHYPGTIETPFVAGMNRLSSYTGIINNCNFPINKCSNKDNSEDQDFLGTEDYLLIQYCPVLSALYGDTTFGEANKIGGLNIQQTSNVNQANGLARFEDFWDPNQGYSMSAIYGGDGSSVYENAMIWASKLTFTLLGADATVSGDVHLGCYNSASLFSQYEQDIDITLNKLIKNASLTQSLKETKGVFALSNAIVNHDIAMKMNMSVKIAADDNSFGNEWIVYAVVTKPFTSLTATTNLRYTIDVQVDSNYVANPRVTDAFAKSIKNEDAEMRFERRGPEARMEESFQESSRGGGGGGRTVSYRAMQGAPLSKLQRHHDPFSEEADTTLAQQCSELPKLYYEQAFGPGRTLPVQPSEVTEDEDEESVTPLYVPRVWEQSMVSPYATLSNVVAINGWKTSVFSRIPIGLSKLNYRPAFNGLMRQYPGLRKAYNGLQRFYSNHEDAFALAATALPILLAEPNPNADLIISKDFQVFKYEEALLAFRGACDPSRYALIVNQLKADIHTMQSITGLTCLQSQLPPLNFIAAPPPVKDTEDNLSDYVETETLQSDSGSKFKASETKRQVTARKSPA